MAKKKSILSPEQRRATTRRLLRFAKPYIAFFIIAFIFAAASSVMAHLIPMLVGPMIGNGINKAKNVPLENAGADAMTTEYIPAPEIFLAGAIFSLLMFGLIPVLVKVSKKNGKEDIA